MQRLSLFVQKVRLPWTDCSEKLHYSKLYYAYEPPANVTLLEELDSLAS